MVTWARTTVVEIEKSEQNNKKNVAETIIRTYDQLDVGGNKEIVDTQFSCLSNCLMVVQLFVMQKMDKF